MVAYHSPGDQIPTARIIYTLVELFFIVASYLYHYGQTDHPANSVVENKRSSSFFLLIISFSFISEMSLVLAGVSQDENDFINHFISTTFFAFVWMSICFRKVFIVSEIFGLSLITITFEYLFLIFEIHQTKRTKIQWISLILEATRITLSTIVLIYTGYKIFRRLTAKQAIKNPEAGSLLGADRSNPNAEAYGTLPDHASHGENPSSARDDAESSDDEEDDSKPLKPSEMESLRKSGSWMSYLKKFQLFIPLLTPKGDLKVQISLVICLACIILERFLNFLLPRQLGKVADKLVSGESPWEHLTFYLLLSLISMVEQTIRPISKIPIEQFSYRRMTNAVFGHVMSLSMDFHADRDSAEVMKGLEQGQSLARLLEVAFLEILPTTVDATVAFVTLYVIFNSTVSLCMIMSSAAFFVLEVTTSTWNITNRRKVNKAQREESGVMHQSVEAWQTVAIFNQFSFEKSRFHTAVQTQLLATRNWLVKQNLISNAVESLMPATFFVLCALVINQVHLGKATPGDFVFLLQYWDYIIWPIRYLCFEYRSLMEYMIDAERLLDLLLLQPTVADKDGAQNLGNIVGHVEFDHVGFSYNETVQTLSEINIQVKPGTTIALVGSTGAGKSTLTKLLLRFYDVTEGKILIDGHDIRHISLSSLRDALGVVPQDPILFNASILDNVRYAKLDATDDEIYSACRGAAIHDRVLSFPEAYNTKVGERGVKLSGGEIQRLAIARVLLKNPPIMILDEATSSVDMLTEAEIQSALRIISKSRTTFIIAHRLSTIVMADQILVVNEGQIVERGTHAELLLKGSHYHKLWQKQFGESSEEPQK